MNALGIAVLGEYVTRIYDQVRARPLYLVERRVNFPEEAEEDSIRAADPREDPAMRVGGWRPMSWERIAVVLLVFVALATRLPAPWGPEVIGDEMLHLESWRNRYRTDDMMPLFMRRLGAQPTVLAEPETGPSRSVPRRTPCSSGPCLSRATPPPPPTRHWVR